MVRGITNFKKRFQGYEEQYVIIGGTACDLIMENEELPFRATKDIDLVLIVEALTAEFGETFWEFIKEAEYDHCNKSTGEAQFYRFTDPKSKEGEKVDSRNIKKHKNDVFRLAQLLDQESKHLDDEVWGDMEQFLLKMENEMIDLKSIGVSGSSKMQILNRLYRCYEIQRKDIVLIDN